MSVPAFLASSFDYKETLAVTDVAAIITDFRDRVLNHNTPAWTEPVAGTFQSPADAKGQFFQVMLTRVSITALGIKIIDMYGTTIADRQIYIDAGGTAVQYYTGQFHAFINSARATQEFGGGCLIDTSPETASLPLYRTAGVGHRDNTGTAGSTDWTFWFMMSNATPAAMRAGVMNYLGSVRCQKAIDGTYIYSPVLLSTNVYGANMRIVGRPFQVLTSDDGLAFGAEVTVPIDVAATGVFKVVGKAASQLQKILVRKA